MKLELARLQIKLIEAEERISRTQLLGSVLFSRNFVQIDSLHIKMQYFALSHLLPGQHSPCYLLIKDCGKGILSVVEYNRLRGKKTALSAEIKSSASKSTLFWYQRCQLLKRNI